MVGHVTFAAPGDLAIPTGGFAYDRRIVRELTRLGWRVDYVDLGEGFPSPRPEQCDAARARLSAAPAGAPIIIDGLAFGVLPELAARLSARRPLIALVHHPLALETGLSAERAARLHASERVALAFASEIVATSPTTARVLAAEYGVAADRIHVARPGNDPGAMAIGSRDDVVNLLAVGAVTPRKGLDALVAALAQAVDLPWRLVIAGALDRDPGCAARLADEIRRHGLEPRVSLVGAVSAERLEQLYLGADLFTLASRYEGYGMAFSEAIAHGLPVIGTTGGAIVETVPAGAGVFVEPGDVGALASELRALIERPGARARMAQHAREAARALPRWEDAATAVAHAVERAAIREFAPRASRG